MRSESEFSSSHLSDGLPDLLFPLLGDPGPIFGEDDVSVLVEPDGQDHFLFFGQHFRASKPRPDDLSQTSDGSAEGDDLTAVKPCLYLFLHCKPLLRV